MLLSLIAVLAILTPQNGAEVPTLRAGQKTYFTTARPERFRLMDTPSERVRLFSFGAVQEPVRLAWSGTETDVCTLTIAPEGGERQSFALTNRSEAYVTNLELGRKYDWSVTTASGRAVSASFVTEPDAPRLLRADGVGNFRDLGGWKTLDGRRVRENRILRSAGLRFSTKSEGGVFSSKVRLGKRRVTDEGLATLRDEFKIRTDLELRTRQETAGMETTLLGPDVRWCNISFAAYDFIDNSVRGREPLAKIFRVLTDESSYPILMHCSGGRDRTGTLAFLLNGLLGVPEDDLCRDWEASIFSDQSAGFTSDRIRRLLDYLRTYPGDTVNARIEAFVRSCGIPATDIEKFRQLMLE